MRHHHLDPVLRSALAPTAVAVMLLLVGGWRGWIVLPDPGGDLQRAIAAQVDAEDRTACERFGFLAESDRYRACMLDLLDLRHRDEQLQMTTNF